MSARPTAGAHADFRHSDYRFARQRSDQRARFERSAPIRPLYHDIAAGFFLFAFLAIIAVLS